MGHYEEIVEADKTWQGECDFCKGSDYIACYTSPVITEFLKVTWICWKCQDLINKFVLFRYKLCVMDSSEEVIHLALCDMLHHCLLGEISLAQGKKWSSSNDWASIREMNDIDSDIRKEINAV